MEQTRKKETYSSSGYPVNEKRMGKTMTDPSKTDIRRSISDTTVKNVFSFLK